MTNETSSDPIITTYTQTPPAHFALRIESFSKLKEKLKNDDKYESRVFKAGGFKWKLLLYPCGKKKEVNQNSDHISLYVKLADCTALSNGCMITAKIKFFVFNQLRDNFMKREDGELKHFYALNPEHGLDKVISLKEFNNASKGYLVDDTCAFGVELEGISSKKKVISCTEKLSAMELGNPIIHTWTIENFSKLDKEKRHCSDTFYAGNCEWKLCLKVHSETGNTYLSFFLRLVETDDPQRRVFAEFTLRIKGQCRNVVQNTASHLFIRPGTEYVFTRLTSLSDLQDACKGYLCNDNLIVQGEFIRLCFPNSTLCKE